jgi:glyoxylase-like metal-dependent hydrolase (beta-lactamase superfamily II)
VLTVGDWNVDVLSLGTITPPRSTLVDTDPADDPLLELAVNALLLRRGDTTVLIDTGIGVTAAVLGLPETDLPGSLRAVGVEPEAIDILCLTHLDFDHVGGAFEGSWPHDLRPAFPHAQVLASAVEIDWSRAGGSGAGFEGGPTAVAALEPGLSPVAAGAEIAPGIRLRAAPGHTPGHSVVEVAGDPALLFLGDVVHAEFLVENPELHVKQDRDPRQGAETRLAFLEESERRGLQVVATHVGSSSPARIVRVDGRFRWTSI